MYTFKQIRSGLIYIMKMIYTVLKITYPTTFLKINYEILISLV